MENLIPGGAGLHATHGARRQAHSPRPYSVARHAVAAVASHRPGVASPARPCHSLQSPRRLQPQEVYEMQHPRRGGKDGGKFKEMHLTRQTSDFSPLRMAGAWLRGWVNEYKEYIISKLETRHISLKYVGLIDTVDCRWLVLWQKLLCQIFNEWSP